MQSDMTLTLFMRFLIRMKDTVNLKHKLERSGIWP